MEMEADATMGLEIVSMPTRRESVSPTTEATSIPRNENETLEVEDDNKSNLKSVYWQYFEKLKVDGEWKAKCFHCGKVLSATQRNGTKALKNHVLIHCKKIKLTTSKQSTIAECFVKQGKKGEENFTFDPAYSRKCLAKMVIMHEYPLSVVEHIALREYSASLQPSFKVPSHNTIKKDILQFYEEEKLKTTLPLDQNRSKVAITTNMWTSNQSKGYMVVTAHYIDSSWNLQMRILSFSYVPAPHTSNVLTHTLMKVLLEWNIDRKLSTITLDNCSTNDAMVEELLGRLDSDYLVLKGKLLHMRCAAHILNLIVKDGLDIVKESVEKIRNSVLYWRATAKRHETFVAWCSKLGVPYTRKLVVDCPTRWNSTYVMLETASSYKDVFPRLRQKEPQYKSVPSNEEWELAKDICGKLKVFYDVTQLFSGTQYPTANIYFHKIYEIKLALEKWASSFDPLISHMACNMKRKFEKYWDEVHGIMGVAVVLDPRYKIAFLEYKFSKLYLDSMDCTKQVQRIQQLCYDLVIEYQQKASSSSSNVQEFSAQNHTLSEDQDDDVAYELYLRKLKKAKGSLVKTEFDFYIEENVIPRTLDFDILLWWKVNGAKYPTLQKIARDIFAIPVSSVVSEFAFSASGRLINPNRGSLNKDTIEALMCSQNWLWATCGGKGIKLVTVSDYRTVNDEDEDVEIEK